MSAGASARRRRSPSADWHKRTSLLWALSRFSSTTEAMPLLMTGQRCSACTADAYRRKQLHVCWFGFTKHTNRKGAQTQLRTNSYIHTQARTITYNQTKKHSDAQTHEHNTNTQTQTHTHTHQAPTNTHTSTNSQPHNPTKA